MGIASMIIGIVAVIFGFVPFCGVWAVIPAIVGLGLGIADLIVKSKRGQPKGMAIAGLVLNPLAIIVVVLWYVLFIAAASEAMEEAAKHGVVFQQPGAVPTVPLNSPPTPPQWPAQPGQQGQPLQPMQPMQPMQPAPAQPAPAQPAPAPQPQPQPQPTQ